jgi:hypothetical protein
MLDVGLDVRCLNNLFVKSVWMFVRTYAYTHVYTRIYMTVSLLLRSLGTLV